MAAMIAAGDLHPDANGSVELTDMFDGLVHGTWCGEDLASFQAIGISSYDADNKDTELSRNRCLPMSPCWLKKKAQGGKVTPDLARFINLYTMNGKQTVQHGFSTGVRGGAINGPEFDYAGGKCKFVYPFQFLFCFCFNNNPVFMFTKGSCNGTYPCESRWKTFYESCADPKGRFYRKELACVLCKAQAFGDRGGENAYHPDQSARQWQINNAIFGWLAAFGRMDEQEDKDPFGDHVYFEMEDARTMMFDGKYPVGWERRQWGNISVVQKAAYMNLGCPGTDKITGIYPAPWTNTSCPTDTGAPCFPGIGYCGVVGSICVSNRCLCGRDSNGIGMCATKDPKTGMPTCAARPHPKCDYFGEPCTVVHADNPPAVTVGPYFNN